MAEFIEQPLVETPDDVVQNTAIEIKKPFCEEVNRRYVAIDGVTTKKVGKRLVLTRLYLRSLW